MSITQISSGNFPQISGIYFFDANVWCYIHSPQQSKLYPNENIIYTELLNEIKAKNGLIVVTPVLLSEYINSRIRVYLRDYNKTLPKNAQVNYKTYRDNPASTYQRSIKIVLNEVQDILYDTCMETDIHEDKIINAVSGRILKDGKDVNDTIFMQMCEAREYTLVTHDTDYNICTANILTCNPTLT